jgi:hypothetical protein
MVRLAIAVFGKALPDWGVETSRGSTVLRLQADAIVDCILEPLLAANVSLGGLHALVTEQELDLLDLAARVVTQASASAPQIWGATPAKPH